jgi:hypothetical protein
MSYNMKLSFYMKTASKSTTMLVTNSSQSKNKLLRICQDKIKVDDMILEYSETVKYLGVIVDYRLMFDEHIKYNAAKISRKTGYLMRIGRYLSKWSKKTVFNTIVAPHYEYCASIYLGANKQDINKLQMLQNKAMRCILRCDWYTPKTEMLRSLEWLSVKQRIKFKALVFIHNIINNNNNVFQEMLVLNKQIHNHDTRSAQNFHMYQQNNRSGQKSLFCDGLKLYNELPTKYKQMSTSKFKKNLQIWLKNE